MFVRATYLKEAGDNEFLIRYEYSNKDQSDAIWGSAACGLPSRDCYPGSHLWLPYADSAYTGESPYRVDRNGVSFDEQKQIL